MRVFCQQALRSYRLSVKTPTMAVEIRLGNDFKEVLLKYKNRF